MPLVIPRTVNVHEAKIHLSRLLEAVEAGEDVMIARAGKPIARLVPAALWTEPRVPGAWRGRPPGRWRPRRRGAS